MERSNEEENYDEPMTIQHMFNVLGQKAMTIEDECTTLLGFLSADKSERYAEKCKHHRNEEKIPIEIHPERLAVELRQMCTLATRLRHLIAPLQLTDPLKEVLKFLPRKQLCHSLRLVDRFMCATVDARMGHWPRYKFGTLIVFCDEDLRRTDRMLLFKNAVHLQPPPDQLASILCAIDNRGLFDAKTPVVLLAHHSDAVDSAQPKTVFLFVDTEEKEEEEDDEGQIEFCTQRVRSQNFFVQLPNRINTKLALAHCLFLFQEIGQIHFGKVHFGLFRWTNSLYALLKQYDLAACLPIACNNFQTYHPVPVPFLRQSLCASECITVWDMDGTAEFFRYLIGTREGGPVNERRESAKKRQREDWLRAWGLVPQMIPSTLVDDTTSTDEDLTFFDALIHVASTCKNADLMVRRIDLKFRQNPAPWPRIVPAMRLVYRAHTFKVDEDEEDGATASEIVEVRYRLLGADGTGLKFEVRIECVPSTVNEEMYAFVLIREEEEEQKSGG